MTPSENLLAKKKIPIVDLSSQYKFIKQEIDTALSSVLMSGSYILGSNVEAFEEELANFLNSKYVISCANGTDAISLALMALGIGQGDEVITVAHSFFATSEAVALVGAKPVFVDILENDFNIDPEKIEKAITKHTKAIMPVHLYGGSCEIGLVADIAKKYGLCLIEDCAQAIGAQYNEKYVGTFGDIGTFSFFPTKNLGAFGDGGAVCTSSYELAQKIKKLRVHGSPKRYVHDFIGLNSRLDEIQAAILRVKLKYLDKWNTDRQIAAKYYDALLKDIKDVITPYVKASCHHVFHQYTIRLPKRDLICEKLNELGIETIVYYPIPIHLQKAFSNLGYKKGSLPLTEKICNEILSLPIYPDIKSEVQEYIADNIKKIL